MPRKREIKINNFINSNKEKNDLNPTAKRDYKAITIRFNEYEWNMLNEASKIKMLRTVTYIRHTLMNNAKKLIDGSN